MSLRDGTKKMSKSDPSEFSRINLTDDADTIADKIRRAKTDLEPMPFDVAGLERRPRLTILLASMPRSVVSARRRWLSEFGGRHFRNSAGANRTAR
jgi:tryptophanyl-tRNA synthetase